MDTRRWTTTTEDGSAGAGASGGSGGEGAGAQGGAGQGGAGQPFYSGFTREDLRTHPSVQNFKSAEDLAYGYVSLEKRFGVDPARRIDLPADPNDADGMRAVYAKLGMPEKADGYGIQLGEGATDADKAMLGKAVETFHKAGLSVAQAKVIGEFINEQTAAQQTAAVEAFKAQAEAGKAALQKEWGQAFEQRSKEIGNLIAKYGDEDLVKELDGEKLGNYPNLARMLGKMLDRMAEPGAPGGLSGDAAGAERAMTPDQAKAAARVQEAHPAFRDKKHPQHAAVVAERNRLLGLAQPVKA